MSNFIVTKQGGCRCAINIDLVRSVYKSLDDKKVWIHWGPNESDDLIDMTFDEFLSACNQVAA